MAEVEWEGSLEEQILGTELDVGVYEQDIVKKQRRLNYLRSLAAEKQEEEEEQCIICTESYENGWIFEWRVPWIRFVDAYTDFRLVLTVAVRFVKSSLSPESLLTYP